MIEKILQAHSFAGNKAVAPGDIVDVSVDRVIMLDIAGLHPELVNNPPKAAFDPSKMAVIFDHFAPAPSIEVATGTSKIRKLAHRLGVDDFYDYGRAGISHAFAAEKGWLLPGRIIANTDSHSIAAGAYNMLSRGLGTPELLQVICTGRTWFSVGETVNVELNGKIRSPTESKDVFLRMARDIGDLPNDNIEFSGDGITEMTMDQRSVISTMCAELSAEFAIFPYDNVLRNYLENRAEAPFHPVYPDANTSYSKYFSFDMGEIPPMVAFPDSVSRNTKPVSEIGNTPVDQCIIGSCANGRIEDLESAARILNGRKVNPDTRLIVTPATPEIYRTAIRLGYIGKITDAGGMVTNPTCGSCMGGHMGILAEGETAITSTTRNFKGRMGSREAKIYMASSATVAASAVRGCITDPSEFIGGAPD